LHTVLVTGAAGFIGFHVAQRLLALGRKVVGVDNLNAYYDVQLKHDRLAQLEPHRGFAFHRLDLADREETAGLFRSQPFGAVVHLAAQAGVRYSLTNPEAYVSANLVGFANVLEGCRRHEIAHLLYASSSSVYGGGTKLPFAVGDDADHPLSFYAATKRANELMAHSYSHLFGLPATGLRFFSVYGPWGRPDMAMCTFIRAILEGRPIDVYNHGRMQRDLIYIDDAVEGVVRLLDHLPTPDAGQCHDASCARSCRAPWRIYNVGSHRPTELLRVIEILERCLGKTARKNLLPMQPGDLPATFADVDDLARDVGFSPHTPIEDGISRLVTWYCEYHQAGPA
jgi:UDP-glucuronate 4-epimerase